MAANVLAKDFIETETGLMFAVVANGLEQGQVLCFLRYVYQEQGWQKLNTTQANAFLQAHHPEFLHYSPVLDVQLHAVAIDKISRHHQPRQRLQAILQQAAGLVEQDLQQLCALWRQQGLPLQQLGITGSVLIGVQNPHSDLDVVCYSREVFQQCRAINQVLLEQGLLQVLSEQDWQASYARRDCALSYAEYVWHEQRKHNKALINGRKFDLNYINASEVVPAEVYKKAGPIRLQCRVVNADYAFDYPAIFLIEHTEISAVVCFTATYTGQAFAGEWIEVAGILEISNRGEQRIVVGGTREAQGEYIKVIHDPRFLN